MTELPPPPVPTHLLRTHSSPLSAISFSPDNERLYSGDSSGLVVVTSTRSLRPITSWKAHTDGILGVEEWGNRIITHARDNKLHVWTHVEEPPPSFRLGGSATQPGLPVPTLCYSMDVNALNYCRFSLMALPQSDVDGTEAKALIALPNLVDSSVADVWALPSRQRVHAAVGQVGKKSIFSAEPGERSKSGIIMSLHLFSLSRRHPSASSSMNLSEELRLLYAYESGEVMMRRYTRTDKQTSVEGVGWEIVWSVKLHVESVMAMRVSKANDLALTVSADHLIGRYDLSSIDDTPEIACVAHRTKYPGNSSIAIRDDGKVCAVGGWDGRIRLYTTKTLKHLGTLKYHKDACQVVEFARSTDVVATHTASVNTIDDGESDDEMSEAEKAQRARWLAAGSKDNRVSIWALISFQKD